MSQVLQRKKFGSDIIQKISEVQEVDEPSQAIEVECSQVVVTDEGEDVDVVNEETDVVDEIDVVTEDVDVVNEDDDIPDAIQPTQNSEEPTPTKEKKEEKEERKEEEEEGSESEESDKEVKLEKDKEEKEKKKKKSLKVELERKDKRKQETPKKNTSKHPTRLISVKTLNDYIRNITHDICKEAWIENKELRFQKGALKNCRTVAQGFLSGLFKKCKVMMQYKGVETVDLITLATCLKFHPQSDMFREKIVELEKKARDIKAEKRERRAMKKLGFDPATITVDQKKLLLNKKSLKLIERMEKIKTEESSKKRKSEEDTSGAEDKSMEKLMRKVKS